MKNRAVYPGSFDPVTYGHLDVIKRGLRIFDEVIVAVAHNPIKTPLFSVEERVHMLKQVTRGMKGVVVDDFKGLAVKYVRKQKAKVVIRGLRMLSDFEYEFQMALTNRKLDSGIETIFMMPSESYAYLSSQLIKEAAALGANIGAFVPKLVEKELIERLRHHRAG
ncbi:MAG: pantetheine-phosphate adenylyltransferase [Candidatus Omnitrophica bacterium]|nr:pantetheine-phosphate adenylyltransferase [Candidatus Omnitrophota bacterium]